MTDFLKNFLLAVPFLIALDYLWIGVVMSGFYQGHLHDLLRFVDGSFSVRIIPTILSYVTMGLSVALFSIPKALTLGSAPKAFLWGALLGLVVFGLYNYTNLAILDKWSSTLSIVDTLCGGVIFGLTTLIVYLIRS